MCHIFIWLSDVSLNSWLLTGEVTAAAAAGWGIICETIEGGAIFRKVAQRLIIWGVVLETFFTVALFVSEEINTRIAKAIAANAIERAAQIERITAWRRITPEQKARITMGLRGHLPPAIVVNGDNNDPEAILYRAEITDIFAAAGGNVMKFNAGGPSEPLFGVYISVSPNVDISPIETAFSDAGIALTQYPDAISRGVLPFIFAGTRDPLAIDDPPPGRHHPEHRPEGLWIFIGHKPLPQ